MLVRCQDKEIDNRAAQQVPIGFGARFANQDREFVLEFGRLAQMPVFVEALAEALRG